MTDRKPSVPIIRTKLHRPPVARDLVCRKALHDRLEEGDHQPLTLVSAPAGYGKSTLVGHWLETHDGPSAWLSLDESDGDIRVFLRYVVAAIQTVLPEACAGTLVQLDAQELPPRPVLAGYLSNDLEDLEESLVLALNDYHRINDSAVHELLNHLLNHPAGPLQLVIISRYDPPLMLGALRAHNRVTEIRTQDLIFMPSETATFLEQATGQTVSSAALACLHRSTEGWVAGLRLAALALRHRSDADAFLRGFNCDVRTVQDYLVEEVLAQQLPATVDCLCRTSILDGFCAPLCEAVGAAPGDGHGDPLDGSTFIRLLQEEGLFCVALDEREEWYRYHHLFQELLQRQLKARLGPDKIAGLHRRAASWFEAQGLLEEAIHHVQQADGPAEAGRLIVRHRNAILNGEQWHRLDQWLGRLPTRTIGNDPELIMLQAWRLQNHGRYSEAFSMLDRIGEVIDNRLPPPTIERLRGAVHALRCAQKYQEGQGERAVQHSEKALSLLPPDCLSERAYAVVFGSAAHQMCGDLDRAHTLIRGHLADTSLPLGTFQVRLERGQCFMHWVAADLPSLRSAIKRVRELSERLELAESLKLASYLCGIVDYELNRLAQAETILASLVTIGKPPNLEFYAQSAFALASVYQASGRAKKARETATSLCEYLLDIGNSSLLQLAQAYRADLAVRQGRLGEGLEWARRFVPQPFGPNHRFFEPRLALARALIAEGEKTSLESAAVLLQRLEVFYAGIHSTRLLIEVLALKALALDAQGEESIARDSLASAIHLAQPGGFIRLFVDLGPGVSRLITGLDLDAKGLRYVKRILAAFRGDEQIQLSETQDHSLTNRELEILALLAKQLSNKQISDRLCISPATVKRHTKNIYGKLEVPDRRNAVAKAVALSIL